MSLEIEDKLLKIHSDRQKILANAQNGGGDTNIDKAIIFNGTSDELIRAINGAKKKSNKNILDMNPSYHDDAS